ncbi:MAG: hypothetical protein M3198_04640, partial [Actinomycetota bacterium]|nr:hypothetical protein [Actinomycetota bacterium]
MRTYLGSLVAAAVIAACAGGDGDRPGVRVDDAPATTTTRETSTTPLPANASDVAIRYFDAFATDRPQAMQVMLDLSVPDSPSHTYARFQIALSQAEADQGAPPDPPEVQRDGGTIRLCQVGEPPPGVDPCTTFGDFTAAPGSNLLTSFTVNGKPISDRLVPGGSTASAGGARFTLAVGYQSVHGEMLLLVVDVANG